MIMSMTGYGKAVLEAGGRIWQVEVRSVNNRNFDCSVHIPRSFIFAEDKLKALCRNHISRGKIDLYYTVTDAQNVSAKVSANAALARAYYDCVQLLADSLNIPNGLSALDLARFPDVISQASEETDEDLALRTLLDATEQALASYDAMREKEGSRLRDDVLERKDRIDGLVGEVERLSPLSVTKYRSRLYDKVKEVLEDRNVDEARILQECAIFADKIAVDEETVRLRSHLSQLDQMLQTGSPIGKNMDFLVQEMNRETNTIGSKCSEIEITQIVIQIKGEIEKIREQIQNIE